MKCPVCLHIRYILDYFTVLDNGILMSTANMTDLIDHPVSLVVREELPESNVSTNHTVQLYVLDRYFCSFLL